MFKLVGMLMIGSAGATATQKRKIIYLHVLSSTYGYVVVDNKAGMEHLSRRTTNNVDLLCIVAEPISIGIITIRRIFDIVKQLPIVVKRTSIIWNRADNGK